MNSEKSYAQALFQVATEADHVTTTYQFLLDVCEVLNGSPSLSRLWAASFLKPEDVADSVTVVATALKASPLETRFLMLLAVRRRLKYLPLIQKCFEALLLKARGIVPVVATSAVAFTPEDQRALESALSRHLKRSPRMTYRTDPSLLGGFTVVYETWRWDGSLRTMFERYKEALLTLPAPSFLAQTASAS